MKTGRGKRRTALMLALLMTMSLLCGAKPVVRGRSPEEPSSLAERLEGKYVRELGGGEFFCMELTEAYGNLYAEGSYAYADGGEEYGVFSPYSFYAMELVPEEAGALQRTDTDGCDIGAVTFSVMSNLGKYQGAPSRCRIVLTEDGFAFEGMENGPGEDAAEEGVSRVEFVRDGRVEDTFPYYSAFPGAAGGSGESPFRRPLKKAALKKLSGVWRETDPEEGSPLYLEFMNHEAAEADGTVQFFRKTAGEEVFFARGSFCLDGISDGETGFHAVCSVLGNGTAPWDSDLTLNADGLITADDGTVFERVEDESEIPLTVLFRPDDPGAFSEDPAVVLPDGAVRPVVPQFAAAEDVENNGGYFVRLDGAVYFRAYGEEIRQEHVPEGRFLTDSPQGFGQEGTVCRFDPETGETGEAFRDGGYGPLWYLDGKFYTQIMDPETGHMNVFSFFPDGSGREQMSFGGYDRINGVSESGRRLLICQEDDNRYQVFDGSLYPETFEPGENRSFVYFCFAGETPVCAVYDAADEQIRIIQQGSGRDEELCLGVLPESEVIPGAKPEVVQHFYCDGQLYLGLAWYNGPDIELDDYAVVRTVIGGENSLEVVYTGVPDGFEGIQERMPQFFLNYADDVLFTGRDPSGEVMLSEGSYGDLLFFDSPFSVMPVISGYIPEDPLTVKNEPVRILQEAEYAGGAVWLIIADAVCRDDYSNSPWVSFDLEGLSWTRIQVDGIPMTADGGAFEEVPVLHAEASGSSGGEALHAWFEKDRWPDGSAPEQGSYDEFFADDSEYQVRVWFESEEELPDFTFYELFFREIDAEGEAVYEAAELYRQESLRPERPLLIGMTFYGDMTEYAVSYTGEDGEPVYYAVSLSGKDGSLYFRVLE